MGYLGNTPGFGGPPVAFRFLGLQGVVDTTGGVTGTKFSGLDVNNLIFSYTKGFLAIYLGGHRLSPDDFEAIDGTSFKIKALLEPTAEVFLIADSPWNPANTWSRDQADARFAPVAKAADLQCYLAVTGSSQLTLFPWEGGTLFVNGSQRQIPQAGLVFNGTGTASTLYYVYVTDALTLSLSTTAPTTDATGKRVSATSRLVGWVFTAGDGTFLDTPTARLCRYVGDKGVLAANFGPSYGVSLTTVPSVVNVSYLALAGEVITASVDFDNASNNVAGQYIRYGICEGPGLTPPNSMSPLASTLFTMPANTYIGGAVTRSIVAPSTGVRTAGFMGRANADGVYTTQFGGINTVVMTQGVR